MSSIVTVTERETGIGPVHAARNQAFPVVVTLRGVDCYGAKVNLREEEALKLASDLVKLVERRQAQRVVDEVTAASDEADAADEAAIDRERDNEYERLQKGPDMTGSDQMGGR